MGATTEINKISLTIQPNRLTGGNAGNNLSLVFLTHVPEKCHCLIAIPFLTGNTVVGLHQLSHTRFNSFQVFRSKGALKRKVIVKTIFNHRANGHLSRRKQLLHCHSQQVRRGVANNIKRLIRAIGNNRQTGVFAHQIGGINNLTIDHTGQGSFGQTSTNIGGNIGYRNRIIENPLGSIGQGNCGHSAFLFSGDPYQRPHELNIYARILPCIALDTSLFKV